MKLSSYAHTLLIAIGTVFILYVAQGFLIPLVLGAFFGFLFDAIGKKISQAWFKKEAAKIVGILLLLGSIILLIYGLSVLWVYLEGHFDQFVTALQNSFATAKETVLTISYLNEESISIALNKLGDSVSFTSFNGLVWSTFAFLFNAILVIVYAILFIVYREKIALLLELLIPWAGKEHLATIYETVYEYMKGLFALVFVVAVLYAVWLWVIGVEYGLLIALWAATMTLVPTVGTFFGGISAVIATWLLSWSMLKAWLVAIWFVVIQTLEEYFILPKVVGERVELNIFATIVSIVGRWLLRGVAGIFLSIPIMGVWAKLLEKQKSRWSNLLE